MAEYHRDIDNCIAALHTLRMAQDYYAGSEGTYRIAKEVITMLGGVKDEGYSNPPLRLAIAQAIHRTYVGPVPTEPTAES